MRFYKAEIFHARTGRFKNSFRYGGLYFDFWLDEEGLSSPRYFSWEQFNLFSFYRKDHGDRTDGSLKDWALGQLEKAGLHDFKGRIRLVTMPRILGYVFNPVSFWYCYDGDQLKAVICEVNNTFGESHNYVVLDPLEKKESPLEKVFHVSPFYSVKGNYRFDFTRENFVAIHYESENGPFVATLKGQPIEEQELSLLRLFFSKPFYTVIVVFLIHYQALKLFLKKVPFYPKPKQREPRTTFEYLKDLSNEAKNEEIYP